MSTTETEIDAADYQRLLAKLGACREARHAADGKSLQQVWDSCERGDWLLWLGAKIDIDRKLLVRAACDCARTALQFAPAGEMRPLKCIETTEAWCEGKATIEQVKETRATAADAYVDAAAAAAAAYAYAARSKARKQHADLVRERIQFAVIRDAAIKQLSQE